LHHFACATQNSFRFVAAEKSYLVSNIPHFVWPSISSTVAVFGKLSDDFESNLLIFVHQRLFLACGASLAGISYGVCQHFLSQKRRCVGSWLYSEIGS
jgi:hypothetical protein